MGQEKDQENCFWRANQITPHPLRRLGVVVLVGIVLAFAVMLSHAHDNPEDWVGQRGYKNRAGELCCGARDCHEIDPAQIRTGSTGYILSNGDVVPFDAAQPSEDKMFWECIWGGERKCFFAPIGGT